MKFTKDNLIAGETIVIDEDGNERLVLEVWENSFSVSLSSNFTKLAYSLTFKEAEAEGWKIKGVKEKTKVEEFEEWLLRNASVGDLRIAQKVLDKVKQLFGDNS